MALDLLQSALTELGNTSCHVIHEHLSEYLQFWLGDDYNYLRVFVRGRYFELIWVTETGDTTHSVCGPKFLISDPDTVSNLDLMISNCVCEFLKSHSCITALFPDMYKERYVLPK